MDQDKVRCENIENLDEAPVNEQDFPASTVPSYNVQSTTASAITGRKSFCGELAFWGGYNHPIPFFKTMLGPLKMFRSPIVLWTSAIYMTAVTWIVILTVGASQIFSRPPYSFSVANIGNTFVSPFIASIIGTLVAKPMIDGGARFLAKKNQGVFGRWTPHGARSQNR